MRCLLVAGLLFVASLCADAAPLVVLRQPASANDPRDTYPRAFIRLALRRRSPPTAPTPSSTHHA